jgi:hypothetical protein
MKVSDLFTHIKVRIILKISYNNENQLTEYLPQTTPERKIITPINTPNG